MVIICNDANCGSMRLVSWSGSPTADRKPSHQGLHKNCEEEMGEGIPLEDASVDVDGGAVLHCMLM